MEATPRFELGIKVLQTTALPLGYVAILARVAGFEPAHDGIRIHCLTTWLYPNNTILIFHSLYMGWVVGFEPTHTGATTLGLNRLTIPTIQCSSFFRAAASQLSSQLRPGRCSSLSTWKIGDRERARTVDLQRDRLAF